MRARLSVLEEENRKEEPGQPPVLPDPRVRSTLVPSKRVDWEAVAVALLLGVGFGMLVGNYAVRKPRVFSHAPFWGDAKSAVTGGHPEDINGM